MTDLISRQAAIDALNERCESECEYSKKQRSVMCNACYLGSAKEVVKDLPTVDPVKHGKWINYKGLYKCSVCNELWTHWWAVVMPEDHMYKEMNYCPNCGAMMDGKEQKSYADWVVKRE